MKSVAHLRNGGWCERAPPVYLSAYGVAGTLADEVRPDAILCCG